MKRPFSIYPIAAIAAIILSSCSTSAEKMDAAKADVQEAFIDLNKAEADYQDQTNKFRMESQEQLSANEKAIAELKDNTMNINKETKEDYREKLTKLEEKNTTLKVKMSGNKEKDHQKWESFKREFKHDMDELAQALTDLTKNNVK